MKFAIWSFFENAFEATLRSKTNALNLLKITFFSLFCKFLSEKGGTVYWKSARQSIQICLNRNLVIRNFLENAFEATLRSKTNALNFLKITFFSLFCKFLSEKGGTVYWKSARQSIQICLNRNLVIRNFLENAFEATWRSKMNVLNSWKWCFLFFANFWVRSCSWNGFWKCEVKR